MSDAAIFQIAGGVAMVVGVLLSFRQQPPSENSGRVGPLEFKVSSPSLMVFIVGALLFCFPFTVAFREQVQSPEVRRSDANSEISASASGETPIVASTSDIDTSESIKTPAIVESSPAKTIAEESALNASFDFSKLDNKNLKIRLDNCHIDPQVFDNLVNQLRAHVHSLASTQSNTAARGGHIVYYYPEDKESADLINAQLSPVWPDIGPVIQANKLPEYTYEHGELSVGLDGGNCTSPKSS